MFEAEIKDADEVEIEQELERMESLKRSCDVEAHRGARRMAMGGFGILIVYWGAVARLTFWDYGWDVMEPITYLSGLSMVILGYLWYAFRVASSLRWSRLR